MNDNHMPAPIAEAVVAIMAKVRNVEKQGENKFHNYKFARVEDLIFQVQPAMAEAGLVITQDELSHGIEADAVMLATYAFSLSHVSGVTWGPVRQTGMAAARNTKGGWDDKALNKCHTAARKYFILGLFQVPAGDLPDADVEADRESPATAADKPVPVTERGVYIACQAAIDLCDTEAKLAGWANDNRASMAKIEADDPQVRDAVLAYWKGRLKAVRAAPKPKPVETFDVIDGDEIPF